MSLAIPLASNLTAHCDGCPSDTTECLYVCTCIMTIKTLYYTTDAQIYNS